MTATAKGQNYYRCKHRGKGCKLPVRSNKGLLRAAVLGLELLLDEDMRDAIRRHLAKRRQPDAVRRRRTPGAGRGASHPSVRNRPSCSRSTTRDSSTTTNRSPENKHAIADEIDTIPANTTPTTVAAEAVHNFELDSRFEDLVALLDDINISDLWPHATDAERRVLLDELIEFVEVHEDHLSVHLNGAPPLRVAYDEVGLKHSGLSRVVGPIHAPHASHGCPWSGPWRFHQKE